MRKHSLPSPMGYDKQHVPILPGAEGYDLVASTYDRDQRQYDEVDLRAFTAALPESLAGLRALDAGGGTGRWGVRLLQRGAAVVVSDPSPSMLALARKKDPRLEVVVAPVEALPFPDGTFSATVCSFVLGYCPDLAPALRELVRTLAPGGLLLIAHAPERKSPIHRVSGKRPFLLDVTYHRPEEIAEALEQLDCTVEVEHVWARSGALAGTLFVVRKA